MAKRGRPFKEDKRNNRCEIRLNDEEAKMLTSVSKKLCMGRADTIRTLIEKFDKEN